MTREDYVRLSVGDVIGDMHYGMSGIRNKCGKDFVVSDPHVLETEMGSSLIKDVVSKYRGDPLYSYHNKYAVVVDDCVRQGFVVVAYSYDARRFGLFTIGPKEE